MGDSGGESESQDKTKPFYDTCGKRVKFGPRFNKTRPYTRHQVLRNSSIREGVTDLRTDGRTDRRTDGRTGPLIEVLRST